MRGKDGLRWVTVTLVFVLFLLRVAPYVLPVVTLSEMVDQPTVMMSEPEGEGLLLAYTPHNPIIINSDANFTATALAKGWSGNGTSIDPYLIEGLEINLSGGAGHCINISNTRVHFIIYNCNLTGANVSPGSGVYLYNVTNSEIVDNTCTYNYYGIFFQSSSNINTVANNTCSNNDGYGIYLNESDSNTVVNNICYSNSIMAINLYEADSNTLVNNTCNGNGGSAIRLFYYCSNNVVANSTCNSNAGYAIYIFFYSSDNTIANNTCYDNSFGIRITSSSDSNTITNNNITDNSYGIFFQTSISNTIEDNICRDNDNDGIYFSTDSNGNDIMWNVFADNNRNGYDNAFTNVFDYNYWSNYVGVDAGLDGYGDTPYTIVGRGSQDPHPLIIPFDRSPLSWVEKPIDMISKSNESFRLNLNATAYGVIDTWWLNDTINFDIDQAGIVTNATVLSLGMFGLEVFVNDTYGNVLSGTFDVNAEDWSLPIWSELLTDQPIECGDSLHYDLNATDPSGLSTWWLNDTLHFAIDDVGLVTTLGIVPVGVYGVLVYVNDTWGNILIGTFVLTVVDTTPPSWIETPKDQIVEYGDYLVYDLNATDLSETGEWWLNDTLHCAIDDEGLVTTIGVVPVGVYGVEVSVNDTWGNVLIGTFSLTVDDTTPPSWIETPDNQNVEYSSDFICDLNATDLSGIGDWWVDDTLRFTVDWTGIVRTVGILEPGLYGLIIYVNDIYENTLWSAIVVEVRDTLTPEWLTDVANQFIEHGEGFEYQLSAFDLSGIDHWSLNDTLNFDISSTGRITSKSILEPGHYGLLVTVSDPYGNELSTVFTVFVTVATTTTTIPTSTTTTVEGDFPLILIIGLVVCGLVTVIVIILYIKRQRSS